MINYRTVPYGCFFVILMTLAAGAQMAHAAKGGRSDFYQKYMSRPSEELIRIGKDYRLRKNKPDSALLFFTIVAGRYTPNMSAEEKREVVEALNMNYFIYSFTYLNYPKAYENLLRAHTISKKLGETSAALYFNLGSMYQLVAGQGRQWKLYSKALDCYRKGVRLALGEEGAEKLYVKYKIGDGMQSVYQTYAIFYEDMGRKADYDRSMYRYYQINDSLKAYSLPSNVFNMGLNEKVIELNQEMDGMKERQTQHRI